MRFPILVSAAALIFSLTLRAEEKAATGPTGTTDGKVVVQVGESGDYQFEVKIDPAKKSVSVFSLGSQKRKDLPNEMNLSLFTDPTTGETVRLKAVNLAPQSGTPQRAQPPVYQGKLDISAGSYVGLEIQLPLPKGKGWKRIRQDEAFSIDR